MLLVTTLKLLGENDVLYKHSFVFHLEFKYYSPADAISVGQTPGYVYSMC